MMIPGLPEVGSAAVLAVLKHQQDLEQFVLYGSRAMDRHNSGSDGDLCLVAPSFQLEDLLLLGVHQLAGAAFARGVRRAADHCRMGAGVDAAVGDRPHRWLCLLTFRDFG